MSRSDQPEDHPSAAGEAVVVAVAIRVRLGETLPTGRIAGVTDQVTHMAPVPPGGPAEQLRTFCGLTFHGSQVEYVPVPRFLHGMGCTACLLVAPQVQLV